MIRHRAETVTKTGISTKVWSAPDHVAGADRDLGPVRESWAVVRGDADVALVCRLAPQRRPRRRGVARGGEAAGERGGFFGRGAGGGTGVLFFFCCGGGGVVRVLTGLGTSARDDVRRVLINAVLLSSP